jgi:hypothetical protein
MRTLTVVEDPELWEVFVFMYPEVKDAKDTNEIAAIIKQIHKQN